MTLDQNIFREMEKRVGREHLSKRLSRQVQHSAIQFGDSGFKFHLEHFEPVFSVLRIMLKCLGLLERGMKNAMDYRVEEITVALGNLPKSFKNFRILQLSDVHLDGILDQGETLRERIAGLQFDLCVITGDFRFLTFYDYEKAVKNMEQLVDSLRCEYGILGILGNHDFIEMVPLLEAMGIRLLLNEAVSIQREDEAMWIAGTDDCHFYQVDDLPKALRGIPPDGFKILMAHSPELLDEAAQAGVNYYLSGHTHGGQICLPGGIPLITNAHCPRKFVSGTWQYDKMGGYTSRGTGSSGLAVRYFCPPEITLHSFI
jgi:predicted MPP superfamily phosphohydrolase